MPRSRHRHPRLHWPKRINVVASCNGDRIDEREVKIVDIAEDIQGADVVTFKCPNCGQMHESRRYG